MRFGSGLVGLFLHHRGLPLLEAFVGQVVCSRRAVPGGSGLVDGLVVKVAVELHLKRCVFLPVLLGATAMQEEEDDAGHAEEDAAGGDGSVHVSCPSLTQQRE